MLNIEKGNIAVRKVSESYADSLYERTYMVDIVDRDIELPVNTTQYTGEEEMVSEVCDNVLNEDETQTLVEWVEGYLAVQD